MSCFYGGNVGISNTLLQIQHLSGSEKWNKLDAIINLRKAYRCVLERWVVAILMFLIGFSILEFPSLPLIVGYIGTQFTLLFWNKIRALISYGQ